MIFYDFEVFEKDWLAVFIDVTKKKEHVIINSPDKLKALYEANRKDIWVGFNNRHYDQYIMKGILLGMNPKKINDWIIVDNKEGWQYSRAFNKLPMINYDVMPSNDETMKTVGLKTMEGFLGSNIKETDVDFRIKRKLTQEEIEQTVKYCRHDVEQTIKVFLEKVSEFNAVHGIIQAFPKETSLYDIGDSEARITAKVLGCSKTHFVDEFDFFFLPCLKLKKYKYVQEWFAEKRKEALEMGLQDFDKKDKKTWYKSQNFETIVAGIPHTFGFGGLHGASDKPIHRKGQILHVDVNNYYPSMLIAWGLVTRAATNNNFKLVYDTRKAMKKKQVAAAKAGRKAEAKQWKKAQFRYMDDMVIFGKTKEELFALKKEIDIYFRNELKLNIKGNWQVFPSYIRGVDFLGYRTFYKYTLLRKSTCLEMEKKMTAIRNKVEAGNMMNYSEWCSINSYKGWLKYADTFRLYQKYVVPLLPYADDYYIRNIKPNTKKGLKAS